MGSPWRELLFLGGSGLGWDWKRSVTEWVENGGLGSGRAENGVRWVTFRIGLMGKSESLCFGVWKPLAGGRAVRDPRMPMEEPHGLGRGV